MRGRRRTGHKVGDLEEHDGGGDNGVEGDRGAEVCGC
jgi:hypothetical protein